MGDQAGVITSEEKLSPDVDCIHFLKHQTYLRNELPHNLLQDYNYHFPLHRFICYCVGVYEEEKHVHCIQFLKKTNSYKLSRFYVRWFHPENDMSHSPPDSTCFWVNSGASLKKHFFLFTDKLNFFRSTFLYYPEMEKYYRLSSLLDYIFLPECPCTSNEKIYQSPFKFTYPFFKERKKDAPPRQIKNEEKTLGKAGKRKKELHLQKIMRKLVVGDLDHFLHRKYPSLFLEMGKII
jgi:hypothetical protein